MERSSENPGSKPEKSNSGNLPGDSVLPESQIPSGKPGTNSVRGLGFPSKYQRLLCLLSAAAIVLCDQLVKSVVRAELKSVGKITVIGDLFYLQYAENTGAAFSMLSGFRWGFVTIVSGIAVFLIYIIIAGKIREGWLAASVAMILGGGVANLIDRVLYGYVVDYFVISLLPAVFNVGDVFITAGAIAYGIYTVIQIINEKRRPVHESV